MGGQLHNEVHSASPRDALRAMTALDDTCAKKGLVSQDGARIDFHGDAENLKPKHLTVDDLSKVTDTLVVSFVHHNVTSINLKLCVRLTDESIKAIANGCPELKELNIARCYKLTDESIKAIAKGCPELTALNVSWIENLTDESIKAIAQGCHELKQLNVSWILHLTDESIQAIAQGCPSLSKLKARHCALTSLPDDIGDRLPKLRELEIWGNKLTTLPRSIVKLQYLHKLHVKENPLQSPPLEIARQGLEAIRRYFAELDKGAGVSKLLKVVLVGDGEAGKTSLRNALAGRAQPRQLQDDRTIHLDIEKITLSANLDINVYDCGGQEEYVVSQLPYLTGLALYLLVIDARYATDAYLEDKVHRFLVVLQNRVPGAIVLPIVTKVDAVDDGESRCKWLVRRVKIWQEETRLALSDREDNFMPLQVQSPALPVSVDDFDSVNAVRGNILALTQRDPPLLRGVGQQIPTTYMAVLALFGAIAEFGDDDRALAALLDGKAQGLGETTAVSRQGTYRPRTVLRALWDKYRAAMRCPSEKLKRKIADDVFDQATQLWEAQGLVFIDAGLVVLQPSFITELIKPLVDHRLNDDGDLKRMEADIVNFLRSLQRHNNDDYTTLTEGVRSFCESGELTDSLLLSFMWRDIPLDVHHYSQVLELLNASGIICPLQQDAGLSSNRSLAVIPFRLPKEPDQAEREAKWPASPRLNEREFVIRFVPHSGLPTGLAERFAAEVHRLGNSIYAWESGVIIQGSVQYTALAERRGNRLVFAVRFQKHASANALAAWTVLCYGYQILKKLRARLFPGLFYDIRLHCEECCLQKTQQFPGLFCDIGLYCEECRLKNKQHERLLFPGLFYEMRLHCEECRLNSGDQSPATRKFDAKATECVFQPCGHHFRVNVDVQSNGDASLRDFVHSEFQVVHNELLVAKGEIIDFVQQQADRMQTILEGIARKEYEFPKLFMIEPVDKEKWSYFDYLTFANTIVNRTVRIVFICDKCLQPALYNGKRGLEFCVPHSRIASVLRSGQHFCERYGLAIKVSSRMLAAATQHALGVDPSPAFALMSDAVTDAITKDTFLRHYEYVKTIDRLVDGEKAGKAIDTQDVNLQRKAIESYNEFSDFLEAVGFNPKKLHMKPVTNKETGHFQWVHTPTCAGELCDMHFGDASLQSESPPPNRTPGCASESDDVYSNVSAQTESPRPYRTVACASESDDVHSNVSTQTESPRPNRTVACVSESDDMHSNVSTQTESPQPNRAPACACEPENVHFRTRRSKRSGPIVRVTQYTKGKLRRAFASK